MTVVVGEQQLASVFEAIITKKSKSTFGVSFRHVLRELHSAQGKPDFVASTTKLKKTKGSRVRRAGQAMSKPSTATILSLLKRNARRTESYISARSGFTQPVVRSALAELRALGLVRKDPENGYRLTESFPDGDLEMWAFELKISNWQRALYQALQYKSFAHREYVVMSGMQPSGLERHMDKFRSLNVGLFTFDGEKGKLKLVCKARKHKPKSRYHYIYTLGKFLDAAQP